MSRPEEVGRRRFLKYVGASLGLATLGGAGYYLYTGAQPRPVVTGITGRKISLPPPVDKGEVSVEEALLRRRSIRDYTDEPLTIREVGQLLWAAQGITEPSWGGRTAPSGGPTYPLEVYVVAGEGGVVDLDTGVYRYIPQDHSLDMILAGDPVSDLAVAALDQEWVYSGKINIVISAVYERTTDRYGERGVRYVHMEAGHAGQNIYLQAAALRLGTLVCGAFLDDQVKRILRLPEDEEPLYIIPVGRPSGPAGPPRGPA